MKPLYEVKNVNGVVEMFNEMRYKHAPVVKKSEELGTQLLGLQRIFFSFSIGVVVNKIYLK